MVAHMQLKYTCIKTERCTHTSRHCCTFANMHTLLSLRTQVLVENCHALLTGPPLLSQMIPLTGSNFLIVYLQLYTHGQQPTIEFFCTFQHWILICEKTVNDRSYQCTRDSNFIERAVTTSLQTGRLQYTNK